MTTIRHLWFLRRGTAMAAIGQETMRGGANVLSRGLDGQLMIDRATSRNRRAATAVAMSPSVFRLNLARVGL